MKNTFFVVIFSNRLTAIFFILFAGAMGLGTFLESWYSTDAAKIWIYNAWWFEALMGLLALNFIGNIFKYNLLRREKWAVLLLHLSFILILLGAFITRYFGYEGVMPIREGTSERQFLSEKTYLTVFVNGKINGVPMSRKLEDDILLSEHVDHSFRWNYDFNGQPFSISYVNYVENVTEGFVFDASVGARYIKIVEAGSGERHDHYLKEGEIANIHNILFTLNRYQEGAFNIYLKNGLYTFDSPFSGKFMRMSDRFEGVVKKNVRNPLELRALYMFPGIQFVIPEPALRGKIDFVKADKEQENLENALQLKVETEGVSKVVTVLGGKGITNNSKKIKVGNLEFYLQYGSLPISLPFSIHLKDFIAERYPGTENSYSAFKSEITVEDEASFDYEIYMNHVLDYKGFRFFQSSFHPDEKGTILSVNHDRWGTSVTYIGYVMLFISLLGIFFFGKTRFKELSEALKKIQKKRMNLAVLLSVGIQFLNAQNHNHIKQSTINFDSIIQASTLDSEHAAKFGKIMIQDSGGRMKPVNTFSSELLRKVSKRNTYKGLNSDQVLMSIMYNPTTWYSVPIIYLKRGNDSIRSIIGVNSKAKYAPLTAFFDEVGKYKIASQLESAYRAKIPNQFQKDFVEVDKRVNLLYTALQGKVMRIFPIPNDPGNRWVSYPELSTVNFKSLDSLYAHNILPLYFQALGKDKRGKIDYTQADKLLESIKTFQKKFGTGVMPSEEKINAEVLYNKYDIFKKLFSWYLYAGMLLFVILIAQIFKNNHLIQYSVTFLKTTIALLFSLHTLGLIVRWFISGHAPWSDAYESMIYAAWATQLTGLIFGRKSALTIAAATFVSSMILMIAHWNWMDPAIANLPPVLNSYWLMIHVAVIVASYGPFALGMIIGVTALILMTFANGKNKERIKLNIKELTIINELSLTVGLVMLTIGNFLGGMWANESWGRYWGWDPKETWALISIMIYAFVLHMRLIPGLRGTWLFNFMSVVAFSSILMTYFGVNFYLVGLHSYASGDKIITPAFVYYSIVLVMLIGSTSYYFSRKYYQK